MHFTIQSRIQEANADLVFEGFTEDLFTWLSPAFPKMRVLRFDGCKRGDFVSVSLFIPGLPAQTWLSEITAQRSEPGQLHEFIDEGRTLPFFLKQWKHVHRIEQKGNDVEITDAIEFKTPWYFPEIVGLCLLYPSFYSRKRKYVSYFKKN